VTVNEIKQAVNAMCPVLIYSDSPAASRASRVS
jgi:hypothetical protein